MRKIDEILIIAAGVLLFCFLVALSSPAEPPAAHFGLDPIGQAIVRRGAENVDQERRIRLLERQVAQLQRIIFNDPTIRPPRYRETPELPIGAVGASPNSDASPTSQDPPDPETFK